MAAQPVRGCVRSRTQQPREDRPGPPVGKLFGTGVTEPGDRTRLTERERGSRGADASEAAQPPGKPCALERPGFERLGDAVSTSPSRPKGAPGSRRRRPPGRVVSVTRGSSRFTPAQDSRPVQRQGKDAGPHARPHPPRCVSERQGRGDLPAGPSHPTGGRRGGEGPVRRQAQERCFCLRAFSSFPTLTAQSAPPRNFSACYWTGCVCHLKRSIQKAHRHRHCRLRSPPRAPPPRSFVASPGLPGWPWSLWGLRESLGSPVVGGQGLGGG